MQAYFPSSIAPTPSSSLLFSSVLLMILLMMGFAIGFFAYKPPSLSHNKGQKIVLIPIPVLEKPSPRLLIGGRPVLNSLSNIQFDGNTSGESYGVGGQGINLYGNNDLARGGSGTGSSVAVQRNTNGSSYSSEQMQIMMGSSVANSFGNLGTITPNSSHTQGNISRSGPKVITFNAETSTSTSAPLFNMTGSNAVINNDRLSLTNNTITPAHTDEGLPTGILTIEVPANGTSVSVPVQSPVGELSGISTGPFKATLIGLEAVPPIKVSARWSSGFGGGSSLPVVNTSGKASIRPATPLSKGQGGLALIVGGLGLDKELTQRAIEELPPQVTLGFVPYATHVQDWIQKARSLGHETILELPLEPFDYPRADVGEAVLLTTLSPIQNTQRLTWLLGRATGYAGVMNYQGAKFLSKQEVLTPFLSHIGNLGLYMAQTQVPSASIGGQVAQKSGVSYLPDIGMIDRDLTPSAIRRQLESLLKKAPELNRKGQHIAAVGYASTGTLTELIAWLPKLLEKHIPLIPASQAMPAPHPTEGN